MPNRKRKSEAKRAKGRPHPHPHSSAHPVKPERDLTSSDYPSTSSEEKLEDIFYDATDADICLWTIVGDCASALAPSFDRTRSKDQKARSPAVCETGRYPQQRTPYYPKYFSHPTRFSVGIQTVSLEKLGTGVKNPVETLRWGAIDPEEMATLHFESSSSGEEYEDARENFTEEALELSRQEGGRRRRMRSRVNIRDRRDQMVQVSSCPNETFWQKDLGGRNNGKGLERHTCQEFGPDDDSVERAYQDSQDEEPSLCSCLLTVLYWLALMLFVSFLLSVFLAVFLLFSRNHGLGIGPGLLHSDAEHIRNQVNPYLNLRHKRSPPT